MGFEDRDFEQACKELIEFDTENWQLFTQCHEFDFYQQSFQGTGNYQYKAIGTFPDVSPEVCFQAFNDIDFLKSWNDYIVALERRELDGAEYLYWRVKYPSPLSDRDYVLEFEKREMNFKGDKVWVSLQKSARKDVIPEVSGVVRVDDYLIVSAVTSDGSSGSKIYQRCYDDPKGYIPNWIVNWFVKSALPEFIRTLHDACRSYHPSGSQN